MDYVIGDVQGMYDELLALLTTLNYQDGHDRLWFVGDLVNRGPKSLDVLLFLMQLKSKPIITLGNHDLHLLACFHGMQTPNKGDTLDEILAHPGVDEMMQWLQLQRLCYFDKTLNVFMSHAGLPPCWDIETALKLAHEVETTLKSDNAISYFKAMYGNQPARWYDSLNGLDRLRLITNYFTRMRWLTNDGELLLDNKTANAPSNGYHWFKLKRTAPIKADIVFGHWAAINGITNEPNIYALDTGCVWGGELTAICLQTKKRYTHRTATN